MKLRLMTPEGTLFEGEAVSVRGRSPLGEFEILPSHGTWVSSIGPCRVTVHVAAAAYRDEAVAKPLPFAVHGGLIEVHPDSMLILADTAEAGTGIDEGRAEQARVRAEERLKKTDADALEVDSDRARNALARALARLEAHVAGR